MMKPRAKTQNCRETKRSGGLLMHAVGNGLAGESRKRVGGRASDLIVAVLERLLNGWDRDCWLHCEITQCIYRVGDDLRLFVLGAANEHGDNGPGVSSEVTATADCVNCAVTPRA